MIQALKTPRDLRQQALAGARREHILNAARSVFIELGLEAVSMREIAKRAGYTAGAIYSYFSSKEEIYGALLMESLERLNLCVSKAAHDIGGKTDSALEELRTSALAFYQFYRDNPRDLDLGFYLFQGLQARGLTSEWDQKPQGGNATPRKSTIQAWFYSRRGRYRGNGHLCSYCWDTIA